MDKQFFSLDQIADALDQVLQTQPSNAYREITLFLYDNGKTPPAEVASEVSIRKIVSNQRKG